MGTILLASGGSTLPGAVFLDLRCRVIQQKIIFQITCDGCGERAYVEQPLKRGEIPPVDPKLPKGWRAVLEDSAPFQMSGMTFTTKVSRQRCPRCPK